jgi:Tol biopolymer transport system component
MPAGGFAGNPPNAAAAQNKDSNFFGWASNGDLYFDGSDLRRISSDGSNRTTLLSEPAAQIVRSVGCPVGRYIVFVWPGHAGSSKVNIWRVDADGADLRQLTHGTADIAPVCSPDGKWLYYDDFGNFRIMRVATDGGTPEIVPGTVMPNTTFGAAGLEISRDGKLLAFLAARADLNSPGEKTPKIALVPLDAGPKPSVRFLNTDPRVADTAQFTPAGEAVVYPIRENGADNLWLQPLDGSQGRQITNFQSDTIQIVAFSPDGKTLGVMRSHVESDVLLLHDMGASPQ